MLEPNNGTAYTHAHLCIPYSIIQSMPVINSIDNMLIGNQNDNRTRKYRMKVKNCLSRPSLYQRDILYPEVPDAVEVT